VRKRVLAKFLCSSFQVSERRACRLLKFPRSVYYYRSRADPQTELRLRLKDLAAARVRYGYERLHTLLVREGWQINLKRVYRLYHEEGLSLRLKTKKKRISERRVPLSRPTAPDECWSMDFVADRLADGRPFRMLTLVDNFSRVSPAIECDFSLNGQRVVAVLERFKETGLPQTIKVDNGSEFISKVLDAWAHRHGVKLEFSRPGKPTDNAFIESFNGRLRQECLNQNWFTSLAEARQTVEAWRQDYNEYRPHSSLDQKTPSEFVAGWQQTRTDPKAGFLTLEMVQ
jgi:putative transposase